MTDHDLKPTDTLVSREIDLLHRDGYSTAKQAVAIVQPVTHGGQMLEQLKPGSLKLLVNGTEREFRVQGPGEWSSPADPMVLLVFPPNQPIVHGLAIKQTRAYLETLQSDELPWKFAVLDSNGEVTTYTKSRAELLTALRLSDQKRQPLIAAGWLGKAQVAVAGMLPVQGPKILVVFNSLAPAADDIGNRSRAEFDGPAALLFIAKQAGAHIFIANVAGPTVLVPGGDASQGGSDYVDNTIRTGGGPESVPYTLSGAQDQRQLTASAYRDSIAKQVAATTLGGLANTFKELAGQIHRELDENYALTFDLTPEDRDRGSVAVSFILSDPRKHLNLITVYPLTPGPMAGSKAISKQQMASMWKAADRAVTSTDLGIEQRVDYFPLGHGMQPVLPMTALVSWIGAGIAPSTLSVAEYVVDTGLAATVFEREVETTWAGHGISWERDGHLHPGQYLWRVVIHDDSGKVFASSDKRIMVGIPPNPLLAASSLVIGRSCRDTVPNASSLRKRIDVTPEERDKPYFAVDPLRTTDCRLKPAPMDIFSNTDTVHGLLRIYPGGKLEKEPPEKWKARLVLSSIGGNAEFTLNVPFTVDSGSGYVAKFMIPLNTAGIRNGQHTIRLEVTGPGVRSAVGGARSLTIE